MLLIFLEEGVAIPIDEVASIVRVAGVERAGTLENVPEYVRLNTKSSGWYALKHIDFETALAMWAETLADLERT